jgi:hypothetical protein
MRKVLFSTYWRSGPRHQERVLSVMPIMYDLSESEADVLLSTQLASMAPPDAIHFVGTSERLEVFRRAARTQGSAIRERILRSIRKPDTEIGEAVLLITYDVKAGAHQAETLDGRPVRDVMKLHVEQRRTLTQAFIRSGGEEKAPAGVHFAKTSHSHSDRFLRVSRVFEDTAHVHLAAFWIVPRLSSTRPRYIVLDTTGIHDVALIASDYLLAHSQLAVPPLIWSHSSHSGVDSLQPEVIAEGLFLISASTSGGLAQRLLAKGVTADRILTCFSLVPGDERVPGHVACELLDEGYGGLSPIVSQPSDHCSMCRDGSQVIRVEGDQFSLAPPSVEQVRIEARDLDARTKSLLSAFAGSKAFRVYRRDAQDSKVIRDLWVDGTVLLEGNFSRKAKSLEKASASWRHSVSQAMTLDVTTVVASDYSGSDYLANQSLADYRARAQHLRGTNPRELPYLVPEPASAATVIVSAVDREDELVSVSRAMRAFQPEGAAYYLVQFSMFPTSKDREGFLSTLTFGSHGRQTFRLDSLFELNVEVNRTGGSWRMELDTLRRMRRWADSQEIDIPSGVDDRIELLERAVATGLIEDAYWRSPNGDHLQLRSDFTLLDWSLEDPKVTPADLYVLFSVILNSLRHAPGARSLTQNAYHRSILSPKNFDRFSDGILQASILRAARSPELAYANCGSTVSRTMRQLLSDMVLHGLGDPRAEAVNEFLVALCTGAMSLEVPDVQGVADDIEARSESDKHANTLFLARCLKSRGVWAATSHERIAT